MGALLFTGYSVYALLPSARTVGSCGPASAVLRLKASSNNLGALRWKFRELLGFFASSCWRAVKVPCGLHQPFSAYACLVYACNRCSHTMFLKTLPRRVFYRGLVLEGLT